MTWWRRFVDRDGERPGQADGAGRLPTSPAEQSVREETWVPSTTPDAGTATPSTRVLGITGSGVQVRGFDAPAEELVTWWRRLRAQHSSTGLWPVLLGTELGDLAAALTPESRDDYDDAAELRRAESMTIARLRAVRAERLARYGGTDEDEPPGAEPPRVVRRSPATFTVAEQDGLVALVPASAGWQVPVVLGWEGGANYDMQPVEHGVVLRDWQDRYGAELVSLSSDQVLEVLVHRPPTTAAEALDVAREQYAYCPDVVDQGVGTLTALAQDQVGSESWYFWWD